MVMLGFIVFVVHTISKITQSCCEYQLMDWISYCTNEIQYACIISEILVAGEIVSFLTFKSF